MAFLKSSTEISSEKICSLPPNPGYGDCSSEPSIKFYFDVYDLRCKKFLFLNCKGSNQNRFDTEEECIRVCHYTACRPGEIIALSNATTPIICEKPSQCPDGYRCSYDKLFRRHVCCGYSNLDRTCPESSVSYASPTQHSSQRCSPSPTTDQCPENFICLKKERTGHCCKPQRDYCPLGQTPLDETLSGHPKKCNLMQSQFACPEGYECITPYRGNPWGYCCSTRIEARCSDGSDPYLYPENNQPQKCTVGVTTCRVGYSCQGLCNSIVGFCCTKKTSPSTDISNSDTTSDERPWYENATAHHANDGLVTKDDDDSRTSPAPSALVHSYAYDLMTVLSCPYQLTPSYLIDSQIIMECTKTGELRNSCPAPARCVRAPRDVLRRSICCTGSMISYRRSHILP
ncbi:hypothetical protein Y032_0166g87 [Ancylostoma ceylanicum]|nr:hypothetical protein Y032_0166g87 [Ancylostoma ceylanicum]